MTTSAPHTISARARQLVPANLFAVALTLGANILGQPAIANAQFSQDWFDWCINNLDEGVAYCCQHGGGVVRGGACFNPADLKADPGPGTPPKRNLPVYEWVVGAAGHRGAGEDPTPASPRRELRYADSGPDTLRRRDF
jgi:hypothetical protein